jgi:hypothetical protein
VPRVTNGSKNAPELTLVHETTCEIHWDLLCESKLALGICPDIDSSLWFLVQQVTCFMGFLRLRI